MAVPIWRQEDAPFLLFHHTTPEAARLIVETGRFAVGAGALLGPSGIHASSDDPESLTLDEIGERYFFNLWPAAALGGAVVFVGDDEDEPFIHQAESTWVLAAPLGPRDVGGLVVGWGRLTPAGNWDWSVGLLV